MVISSCHLQVDRVLNKGTLESGREAGFSEPGFMYDCQTVPAWSQNWLFPKTWTVALQAPLPMGFPRQEYRSGLPLPSLGDLPRPGTEPKSLLSLFAHKHHHLMRGDWSRVQPSEGGGKGRGLCVCEEHEVGPRVVCVCVCVCVKNAR